MPVATLSRCESVVNVSGLEAINNVTVWVNRIGSVSRLRWLIAVISLIVVLAACGAWSDENASPETPSPSQEPTRSDTATSAPHATATSAVAIPATEQPSPSSTSVPPVPTATALPTVDITQLTPTTKLAHFHTITEVSDAPEELANRADFFILTYGDDPYRDALRLSGYDGLILQYLNASQVNGPGPYSDASAACDAEFSPLRNGIVRDTGAFCRELHPNEEWFLHNGAGQRLYTIIGDSGVLYHMDPGNREWRAFASIAIANEVVGPESHGYDGAFLDNVELSLTRLLEQAENSDGVVREYADDDVYRDAWSIYLRHVRARVGDDVPVWANLVSDPNSGTTWASYLPHLDGVMSPAFATGYDPLTVTKWENNLNEAAAALEGGDGLIAVGLGMKDDEQLQSFALASYLLITDGDDAYFRFMFDESPEALVSLWDYPNYDLKLGQALGQRTKSGEVWRREFQCGYVEVNPKNRTGSIVQTACNNRTAP